MKIKGRIALLLAILIFSVCFLNIFVSAAETSQEEIPKTPGIFTNNALVAYCVEDGQVLYSNRLDERVEPTVATKLMTCMVVSDILAERNLYSSDVTVTVTAAAVQNAGNVFDVRVPIMGFAAGDTCTVKDLLSSVLVASANDAASALACYFGENYLGGDMTSFVDRMNKKCLDLGLKSTHFVNATGISSPEQYSTPKEIAMIASAFYGYNELVTLSDVEFFRYKDRVTIRNGNYLKNGHTINDYVNRNAISIIAGQLDVAGNYCLISASQKDGKTYMFVVMCASGMKVEVKDDGKTYYSFGFGNAYEDMNKLMDWTRKAFSLVTLATKNTAVGELRVNMGSNTDHVMIVPVTDIERLVISNETDNIQKEVKYDFNRVYVANFNGEETYTINAPVSAGEKVGVVVYSYNGTEIATVDVVVKEGVETDGVKVFLAKVEAFLFGDVMKTILIIIVVIIVLYIALLIVSAIIRASNKAQKAVAKKKKENQDRQNENK